MLIYSYILFFLRGLFTIKLKQLSENLFNSGVLLDELVKYVEENEYEKWMTFDEWKEYLHNYHYIFWNDNENMRDYELLANIENMELDSNTLYEYNDVRNEYDSIDERKAYEWVKENTWKEFVGWYDREKSQYKSIVDFLKTNNESILEEMKEYNEWVDDDYINSHKENLELRNPFLNESEYKYVIFNLLRNDSSFDDWKWYRPNDNYDGLEVVSEERIKSSLLDMIKNSKEWKSEFEDLKEYDNKSFKEIDQYLNFKLGKMLSFSRDRY